MALPGGARSAHGRGQLRFNRVNACPGPRARLFAKRRAWGSLFDADQIYFEGRQMRVRLRLSINVAAGLIATAAWIAIVGYAVRAIF